MFQIDGPDVVPVKPAKKPPANLPGWFDGGSPEGNKATQVTRDWLNTLQAEIANVVLSLEPLDRNDDTQLLRAIQALVSVVVDTAIGAIPEPKDPIPVGTILAYHGATAPEGYFLCNGQAFSSATNPKLYAILGNRTNTPNLAGRFLRMTGGNGGGIGTAQEDAGRNATGRIPIGEKFMTIANLYTGPFYLDGNEPNQTGHGKMDADNFKCGFDLSRSWGAAHTANEFRPLSFTVNYIIRHD
jgi:hypothetical protein